VPELWTPVVEGPHEAFVERLHRSFTEFAEANGIAAPVVEIELADTARFVIDKILPDPGFGMITIYVHDRDDDTPDALVIPIGSIRRIELRRSPEDRVARFGFSLPAA
jgi:hypothetical protein